jgi:hypothetical protein
MLFISKDKLEYFCNQPADHNDIGVILYYFLEWMEKLISPSVVLRLAESYFSIISEWYKLWLSGRTDFCL